MEGIYLRSVLLTAVAPAAWGTTYLVTEKFLPPDRPFFAAAVRALPVGLVLLAWTRQLPRRGWWTRAIVLGLCNIGLFFPLLFLSAHRLPGGLAATVQAASPLVVMALAWPLIRERPTPLRVAAALVGLTGVALLVLRNPGGVDPVGIAAAFSSVLVSGLGFVLIKRWVPPVPMLTLVSWQLVVGGIVLVPLALLIEGAPPALDARAVGGLTWLAVVGTGLAYVCWFTGLRRMPAGGVALVGLVNPVVATVLGITFVAEPFGPSQAAGVALVLGGVLAGQVRLPARRRIRLRAGRGQPV